MNLISGVVLSKEESLKALACIEESVTRTLTNQALLCKEVIEACHQLSMQLNESEYLPLLLNLGVSKVKAKEELAMAKQMLCREYIESRINTELGFQQLNEWVPYGETNQMKQQWKPLGVLFHIVAGNVDALPVFSVIEGLLTGNINIVKLPTGDGGLTVIFLKRLIEIQPKIKEYIYVFQYPSQDIESMKKMASVSDAVIVWGGDQAVSSVRKMVSPNTQIIEWGHKISFAYVSGNTVSDDDLTGIAHNMCDTNQLFCSSCQGIYVNTDNENEVATFAQRFANILDTVNKEYQNNDEYITAQKTLEIYTEQLESLSKQKQVFKGKGCGVIAYKDSELVPSYMFRNCWVKPLPKENIIKNLRKYKNHLQTLALICDEDEACELEELFFKTGIVRITKGRNMSKTYCGMPHDGQFSLMRYMKRVSYERE